ncbi:GIY-YIG nuclease family protein [Roseateles sp. BYS87W]|uniref:GIY-YIG nuclease family protein n=1 Tax=Pelomonas baiyunensis TaxID=3299026 RepID=A0ABW7H2J2_9BURK
MKTSSLFGTQPEVASNRVAVRPSIQWSSPQRDSAAAVYLLQRIDRTRFKIGWSFNPSARVKSFYEYFDSALDLPSSHVIWLPSRERAEQSERALHKLLAPYRLHAAPGMAGSSEWFAGASYFRAKAALSVVPLRRDSLKVAVLQPWGSRPQDDLYRPDAQGCTVDPQTQWWLIEDLLLRIVHHRRVSVRATPELALVIHQVRQVPMELGGEWYLLRQRALDTSTYQCWDGPRPLNFVKTLAYEEDDLVLTFMPTSVIERWSGGHDLAWQVKGLIARMKARRSLG